MKKLMKWIKKAEDFIFPPIEFNLSLNKRKKKKTKKRIPTADDLDAWATDYEEKFTKARKRK